MRLVDVFFVCSEPRFQAWLIIPIASYLCPRAYRSNVGLKLAAIHDRFEGLLALSVVVFLAQGCAYTSVARYDQLRGAGMGCSIFVLSAERISRNLPSSSSNVITDTPVIVPRISSKERR